MSYWLREIAGWALILIGLFIFWNAYGLLLNKRVFEAGPVTFMGFIVFRGGIHLLKVAVAAQGALAISERVAPTTRRPGRPTGRPVGPTPAKAVMPGPKSWPNAANAPR